MTVGCRLLERIARQGGRVASLLATAAVCAQQPGEGRQPPTLPAPPISSNAPAGSLTNTIPLDPAVALLDFANGLYVRHFHDMALVEYLRFVQKYDSHPLADEVYYRMGECQRTLKLWPDAKKTFTAITRRWPGSEYSGRAHFRLGEIAYEAKDLPLAATMFTAAAHQTQDEQIRATSLFYLAKSQLESGEADAALDNFRKVLKSRQGEVFRPYTESAVAGLWLKQRDYRQALTHYENVLNLSTTPELREEALYQVGALRYSLKLYAESATAFRQFLKDYPRSRWLTDAAVSLAHALFESKATREAAQVAREWFEVAPKESKPELALIVAGSMREGKAYREAADWFARAGTAAALAEEVRCAFLGSDFARAVQRGEALIQADPKNPFLENAMMVVAESLEALKQWERAAMAYRAFVDKFPQNSWSADALWRATACWQQVSKLGEIIKDFERVVALFPKDSRNEEALYQIGACYGQLDKTPEMIAAFDRLLAAYPKSVYAAEASYWIGSNHLAKQEWAKAATHLEQALALRPADNRKRVSPKLMIAYFHLDQPVKTAEHVQALIERGDAKQVPPEISAWLGEKILAAGRHPEAIPHLQRALERATDPVIRSACSDAMARACTHLRQWDKAAAYYRDVIEIEGANKRGMKAAIGLAESLVKTGDYKDGQETLEKLIEQHPEGPENARIRMLLGDLHVGMKQYHDAGRYYMSVAVLYDDPNITPEALDRAAAAFDACGRTGDAVQARRELDKRFPTYKMFSRNPPPGFPKPDAAASHTGAGTSMEAAKTP